jgi:hypothetical protein
MGLNGLSLPSFVTNFPSSKAAHALSADSNSTIATMLFIILPNIGFAGEMAKKGESIHW